LRQELHGTGRAGGHRDRRRKGLQHLQPGQGEEMAGKKVTVTGKMDGDTITVDTIALAKT
jgi:hypothetical protein